MLTPFLILAVVKDAAPAIVCVPVRYVPLAIVWFEVPGVIVAAPLVVTLAVKVTVTLPAVPALI